MFRSLPSTRYVVALAAAAAVPLVASTAAAHPVCDHRTCAEAVVRPVASADDASYDDPYAAPLSALGGRTLAQVLSDHVDRVLGPFPV